MRRPRHRVSQLIVIKVPRFNKQLRSKFSSKSLFCSFTWASVFWGRSVRYVSPRGALSLYTKQFHRALLLWCRLRGLWSVACVCTDTCNSHTAWPLPKKSSCSNNMDEAWRMCISLAFPASVDCLFHRQIAPKIAASYSTFCVCAEQYTRREH